MSRFVEVNTVLIDPDEVIAIKAMAASSGKSFSHVYLRSSHDFTVEYSRDELYKKLFVNPDYYGLEFEVDSMVRKAIGD